MSYFPGLVPLVTAFQLINGTVGVSAHTELYTHTKKKKNSLITAIDFKALPLTIKPWERCRSIDFPGFIQVDMLSTGQTGIIC